jgi:hypothetical protein
MDKIKNDRELQITREKLARVWRSLAEVYAQVSDPEQRAQWEESLNMTVRRLEREIEEYLARQSQEAPVETVSNLEPEAVPA